MSKNERWFWHVKKKKEKKIIRPIRSERGVNFAPKFPPFIRPCSLQRHFADIQRGRFFSKCFSHKKCEKHVGNWGGIVSFVFLSMKKTVESRQNNSGRWESERDVSSSCDFFWATSLSSICLISLSLYSNRPFYFNSFIFNCAFATNSSDFCTSVISLQTLYF